MRLTASIGLGCLLSAGPAYSGGPVELFARVPIRASLPPAGSSLALSIRSYQPDEVELNTSALARLVPDSEVSFTHPNSGNQYVIRTERVDTAPSGATTWVGYLRDHGKNYRVIVTSGAPGAANQAPAFGRLLTPEGEFQLETVPTLDGTAQVLVDRAAAGQQVRLGSHDDTRVPPIAAGLLAARAGPARSQAQAGAAAPTPQSTVDLMLLYTPGMLSALGSVAAVQTRADNLVAIANQAYLDSEVAVRLRLVRLEPVNYSDTADISTTLSALTNGTDPAFAGIAGLRNTYGADVVSLLRRYQGANECGIAWTGGYKQTPMAAYADYGYSVVANGSSGGFFCSDYTLAHELGHNMGSVHDRVTERQPTGVSTGAFSYSFGYGVSGSFSTVMAYASSYTNAPVIGRFSNPNINTCQSMVCGVSEAASNSANNALSLNNTRLAVAAWRATVVPGAPGNTVDVRTYVPAVEAPAGYESYLRVINGGTGATTVSAAVVDARTGVAGPQRVLLANLAASAAQTLTAAQVEAVVGAVAAGQRPRIRLTTSDNGFIRAQSFLLQPGGVFNEVSGAESGSTVTLRTYVPAAVASAGYTSYVRLINTGSAATDVTVAKVDGNTGAVGAARPLIGQLAAGAAQTLTATQVESALGQAVPAQERPRLQLVAASSTLEVQSFLLQPGGFFSQVSSGKTGTTVDVTNYIPAAALGFTSFVRVINPSASAATVSVALLDATTGAAGTPSTLVASLAGGGAQTFTSSQIEAALGQAVPATARPRLRLTAGGTALEVQSFMVQPGGGFDEMSNALAATGLFVRTYVPQADAGSGYVSQLRIANTGTVATPVTVALVDTSGTRGPTATLTSSLAAGAAQNFSASQIEAALGTPIAAGSRPRILVSGNTVLEVQSYLSQPSGALTEVSGGQ